MTDVIPIGIEKDWSELGKDALPGIVLGAVFGVAHKINSAITLNLPPAPLQFFGNFLTAIVVAPVVEESFFRGWLDPWLEEKTGNAYASVFLTAIAFALFHFGVYGQFLIGNILTFLTAFVFSIFFSAIARTTNSLVGSITAHAIINLVILSGAIFAITGI